MEVLTKLRDLVRPIKNRKFLLFVIDAFAFLAVYTVMVIAALITDGNNNFFGTLFNLYLPNFLIFLSFLLTSRLVGRVYTTLWRYANSLSFLRMILVDIIGGALAAVVTAFLPGAFIGVWKSVSVVAIFNVATLSLRFVYQWCYRKLNMLEQDHSGRTRVAIVGAGQVGALLAEELKCTANSKYNPVCFIDTAEDKIGSSISGIPVYEESEDTFELIERLGVKEFIIALPAIDDETEKKIYKYYSRPGYRVKLYDVPLNERFEDGEAEKRIIMDFKVDDLLFRSSKNIIDNKTRDYYRDKTVLVTGGGGSIGSEICRQIAKLSPKQIVIFDIYENNAYDIQQALIRKYGDKLNLAIEIGSVRDPDRLNAVFAHYRPDVVFHAAAHKHVPLMEHSNSEAIKNNIFGTYNTANAAEKYGTKKFVLISTDKAVNPTNVMGASKRMCEMVIQCRTDSETSFTAVRFGNVLGSNGSVIPLFREQIKQGGPITITDSRIVRYFMTIPEASKLVMQAGAMAKKGDLFVLDMGKPIKIIDLAENMIKLSGFVPYKDIDIVEIGLRPGEKLYEELLIKPDKLKKTDNDMIFVERDQPLTRQAVNEKLDKLRKVLEENKNITASPAITEVMKQVVPTYFDPEMVNKKAEEATEMKLAEKV